MTYQVTGDIIIIEEDAFMKKISIIAFIFISLFLFLTSCNTVRPCNEGEHSFGAPEFKDRETDSGCPERTFYKTCTICGYVETISNKILHDYYRYQTYPTCTTLGYDNYVCRVCNAVKKEPSGDDYGPHKFLEEYLSGDDWHWHKCERCNEFSEREEHIEDENGICTLCGAKVDYTDGVVYELSDDQSYAIVSGYEGTNKRIRIAPEYEGVPVTHIGIAAFKYCSDLLSISLTENITHIEEEAFFSCLRLSRIWNMENVKYIGASAFYDNFSLKLDTLPQGLEYIGDNAFFHCRNLSISKIPDSVSYLGTKAFSSCSGLESISLSSSLTEIKDETFDYCNNLDVVDFKEGLVSIGKHAFTHCEKIKTLQFPDSLVSIGESAFSYSYSLTSVHFGKNLKTFNNLAFYGCSRLEQFYVDEDNEYMTSLDGIVYSKDLSTIICCPHTIRVEDLIIPEGIEVIFDYAFYELDSVNNLTLPKSLKTIGRSAFSDCKKINSVTVLGNTAIGDYAFARCYELTELNLSGESITIGNGAFHACGFVNLIIPDNITEMGKSAFISCTNLKSVILGSGLTNIPEAAFRFCTKLTTVVIPEEVEAIGDQAFDSCYDLKRLYYEGTPEEWNNIIKNEEQIRSLYIYYYTETEPETKGKFWHYDEKGNVLVW